MNLSRVPESVRKALIKKVSGKFLQLLKAVGSEGRLSMLVLLCDGVKTWNDFVYGLHMNSKVVRDNLRVLKATKLVRKHKLCGFELTELGVNTLTFLVSLVESLFPDEVEKIKERM